MNITEIKRIIQDQEKEKDKILKEEKIIKRDLDVKSLKKFIEHPNVLAILGIRRCGKSVLSWFLMENKKYGYINFDDEAFYGAEAKDLNTILKAFYELYGNIDFFIFDEIQNIDGWELFANRLRRTKKIIVTGSNSQLLSGELATYLTGRHIDFILFPFSFKEFCIFNKIDVEKSAKSYDTETSAIMENALSEYIEKGGLPESYKYGKQVIKSTFGDIVKKDISKRYNIRSRVIEGLAKHLVTNFSNEISYNKLKNVLSIKKIQTIKNYVRYFEEAYLVFVLERFSYKLKQQTIAPKKIYCIDTGIINSISFRFTENFGRLFENIVCVELFRRKSYIQSDIEIYYWKNAQQEEVDFVIKELKVKQLIQVCYDLSDKETKEREVKAFIKGSVELRCKDLLVITNDYEKEEKIGGKKISYIPLWKWLLKN